MTTPEASLQRDLESGLGARLERLRPVAGGDIAAAYCAELGSGERVFVKRYDPSLEGIGPAEAEGLGWLAEARALRVPRVRLAGPHWLALEWIEPGRPAAGFPETLGRGLAALHAAGAEAFGHPEGRDNWIGRLPQRNAPRPDWASFYGECRLAPLRARAARTGVLSAEVGSLLDELVDALPELVGPDEPPARLHGDLWSGNRLVDEAGAPCLIDPAPYGGHREIDLAMMRLFGGFPERVFDAYEEAFPLASGARERTALYQAYPLLVHVCLFGRGWVGQLVDAVRAALALRGRPV